MPADDTDILCPLSVEEMIELEAEYEERFAAETERFQFRGEHECDNDFPW